MSSHALRARVRKLKGFASTCGKSSFRFKVCRKAGRSAKEVLWKVSGNLLFFFQFFKINNIALSHTLFLLVLCIELQVTGLYLSQLATYTSDATQVAYVKRTAHLSQVLIRQLPSLQNKFSNSLAEAIPLAAWRTKRTGVRTAVPPFRRASRGQGCDVLSRETSCTHDVWAIPAR